MDNKSEAGWNWKVAELSGDHPYGEMWNRVCCNSSGLADAVTKFANALQGRQVYDVSGNPDHAKPDFGKFWSGASEDSQCWQILPTRDTLVDHLMATNERLVGIIESLGRPTVVDFGVPEGKKNA